MTVLAVAAATAGALAGCGTQSGQHSSAVSSAPASTAVPGSARVGPSGQVVRFSRVTLRVPAANRAFGPPRVMTLPRGWTAEVWAMVPAARLETWTPEGDLLVSSPSNGSIAERFPRSVRSRPPVRRTLLSDLDSPQGMAFANLGGTEYLFVAETDEIDRYVWRHGTLGARTGIVHNLPDGGALPLKNVVVAPDHTVYFDIGSASNASPPSGTTPPRATVMAVDPDGHHLRVFATGAGRNLGWPYCDPDPDVSPGHAGTAFNYANLRFDADAQTNPGGRALGCATLRRIQRGLPAHSAPLGFHFLNGSRLSGPWDGGAVVAVHGSWDRQPPRAPAVLWLPWEAGARTLGVPITLVGGFQSPNGSRWGRPVDAVPGPDGALYLSDDQSGAIYRLVPPQK